MPILTLALLAASLLSHVNAASPDTTAACTELYKKYASFVVWDPFGPNGVDTLSNASLYRDIRRDYWNVANADNRAACLFTPASAQHVSDAVKVLNKYPSVQYALKSGGHNSNLGFSSTDQGILISFRPNLASTTVTRDRQYADIGPGSRWEEAAAAVDVYGKTVIGGRLGNVGVGGYILGGGLSFLTAQYASGFACDNVVDYELVLADGTITHANATANTDLFYALKGGGNQFGIVTNFRLKLHPIGQVWGGLRAYSEDQYEAIMGAVTNFTISGADPRAAVITTFNSAVYDAVQTAVVFYFYDGPQPPAGVFGSFLEIPSTVSTTKTQSYPDLLVANNVFSLSGLKYQIRTATYPQLPYRQAVDFLKYHAAESRKFAKSTTMKKLDLQVLSFAVQPIPASLQQRSLDAGGNRLGLDPKHGDKFFMEYDISWVNSAFNKANPLAVEAHVNAVSAYQRATYGGVKPTSYVSGDLDFVPYNPLFANDAMGDQGVYESYGPDTYAKLKQIQRARDPKGLFSQRQNGFKFRT